MREKKVYTLLRILLAGLLLLLMLWWINGQMAGRSARGAQDIVGEDARVAVALKLSPSDAEGLLRSIDSRFKLQTIRELEIVPRLSEANILLILVENWQQMSEFAAVPGLEEVSEKSQAFGAHENRWAGGLEENGEIVLFVVTYMIPDVGNWATNCISSDFTKVLLTGSSRAESELDICLKEAFPG